VPNFSLIRRRFGAKQLKIATGENLIPTLLLVITTFIRHFLNCFLCILARSTHGKAVVCVKTNRFLPGWDVLETRYRRVESKLLIRNTTFADRILFLESFDRSWVELPKVPNNLVLPCFPRPCASSFNLYVGLATPFKYAR